MANLANSLMGNGRVLPRLMLLENRRSYPLDPGIEVFALRGRYRLGPYEKLLTLVLDGWRLRQYLRKHHVSLALSFQQRANFVNVLAKKMGGQHRCLISERIYTKDYYDYKLFKGLAASGLRNLAAGGAHGLVRALYRCADGIVCNAADTRDGLIHYYGIDPDLLHVIPNGYNTDNIRKAASAPVPESMRHLFAEGRTTYLHMGRLCRQKGQEYLLRAYSMLPDRCGSQLLLLGEGPWRKRLEDLARELEIADQVKFLGQIENPFPILAAADCFVFPSLYEGYPNALVEAMICGVPVVAFDFKAGARELLVDGQQGALVPLGEVNALAQAMASWRTPASRRFLTMADVGRRYEDLLLAEG